MDNQAKFNIIMILLAFSLIAVIILLVYFNTHPIENKNNQTTNNISIANNQNQSQNITIRKHTPINLSEDDILVSFRIDDITFETKQKSVLENALYLVRKYNITFDLAVIAKPFDKQADPEVYKIYQDNQDVFEIVAHGLTHSNPVNASIKSEFGGVDPKLQEEHIKQMKQIFEKHNLIWGTKILLLPWSYGDENTIKIAEKYHYNLIFQTKVPNNLEEYNNDNITAIRVYVGFSMNQILSNQEIDNQKQKLNNLIEKDYRRIQIILHPINFLKVKNGEQAIAEIVNQTSSNPNIKFSMISDGVR